MTGVTHLSVSLTSDGDYPFLTVSEDDIEKENTTDLQTAISSGQVSAAQIEAHRAAGELPIQMFEPMASLYVTQAQFDRVFPMSPSPTLRETIDSATDQAIEQLTADGHYELAEALRADIRAALLDAERFQEFLCAAWPESMRSMAIAQIDHAIQRHKGAQS